MPTDSDNTAAPWWKSGVLYQIYPLSFADSNGDGYGDLKGIVEHLEHLQWLGVDAIWLSPITVSPNADWGYDVADYTAIQPDMGTLDSFDGLIAAAHKCGIRVLLDFVPNHTSEEHPWFFDAPGVKPWLPVGDKERNVEDQLDDRHSLLFLTRDLIALRKQTPDLALGAYTPLPAPDDAWAWRRRRSAPRRGQLLRRRGHARRAPRSGLRRHRPFP